MVQIFILQFDNFNICVAHFIDKDDAIINLISNLEDKPLYIFFKDCIYIANNVDITVFDNTQFNLLIPDRCISLVLNCSFQIIKKTEGTIKETYKNELIPILNLYEVKRKLYNINLI